MTIKSGKFNVFVAEDSLAVQRLLVHILSQDSRLHVVRAGDSGDAVHDDLLRTQPDVVVLGVNGAGDRGFATIRHVMESQPVSIVVCVPATLIGDADIADGAAAAGAVAVAARPEGVDHPDYPALAAKLAQTAALMAEVKVVKRWSRTRTAGGLRASATGVDVRPHAARVEILAIGASTGGPPALQTLLAGLPPTFPLPILIVQHIAAGFLPGLATWLSQRTGVSVRIAAHGEAVRAGHVYLAPDGRHLGIGEGGQIELSDSPPDHGLRPSVAHLFRSVASSYGARAVAVLLTGMGKDGAQELKTLRERGAVTIVQDAASCVVNGMPGEADRLGAALYVLAPDRMPALLIRLTSEGSSEARTAPVGD